MSSQCAYCPNKYDKISNEPSADFCGRVHCYMRWFVKWDQIQTKEKIEVETNENKMNVSNLTCEPITSYE